MFPGRFGLFRFVYLSPQNSPGHSSVPGKPSPRMSAAEPLKMLRQVSWDILSLSFGQTDEWSNENDLQVRVLSWPPRLESKEKREYKHTSCDKSWEHSSHSYYSCLQTYESVWICMKYELNWIESYRIRNSHNVPDVPSSSHRPMELKERYAILQCQFTKFSTNLRFGPISTSISSMVLIQLFFFESQPSQPRIFEGFFRLFFSCSISSAGPFSGLVKMGLLKEQEIPYLADRAQRLDMKYTQEILSVPFRMDLDLQTRVEEQSKIRLWVLWGIDRRH